MRTLLLLAAALTAVACGPKTHSSDDAGPPPIDAAVGVDARPGIDATPAPDASATIDAGVEPDAGGTAGAGVRAGSVSGGVTASSAHYKLVGTVSEGGASASSGAYRVRAGVAAESQP